jgi:hypothetical protein
MVVEAKVIKDNTKSVTKSTQDRVERILRNSADFLLSRAQDRLVSNNKVDTGETLQSGKRIRVDNGFAVEFRGAARFIEEGRGPTKGGGTGEVKDQIRKWIQRKGINVDGFQGSTRAQKLDNAAFVISRKIHAKGFPESPFLLPAVEDLKQNQGNIVKKFG